MIFCGTTKKIAAFLTAGALSFTVSFAVPQTAEALSLGSIVNIGVAAAQMAAIKSSVNKQVTYFNETPEGRQELLAQFKEQYGVNEDAAINARVDRLMANLSAAVARVDPSINEKPYIYFVNNDQSINAFCSMGHVASINTGLLNNFPNDDEVAVVVGHEMGHGQKDHTVKGIKSTLNKQMLASIAIAAEGGSTIGQIVGSLALNQSVAHGTKSHEKEADELAFTYITNSNYNPGACAAVWQRFLDTQGDNSQNALGSIFAPSTHPNNAARRDTYVKRLEEYSGNHVTAADGTVKVNGKNFVTTAASGGMSAQERSYFIFGNLAAAYKNKQNTNAATVKNGIVMLGNQPIIEPTADEESANVLAKRLNEIK